MSNIIPDWEKYKSRISILEFIDIVKTPALLIDAIQNIPEYDEGRSGPSELFGGTVAINTLCGFTDCKSHTCFSQWKLGLKIEHTMNQNYKVVGNELSNDLNDHVLYSLEDIRARFKAECKKSNRFVISVELHLIQEQTQQTYYWDTKHQRSFYHFDTVKMIREIHDDNKTFYFNETTQTSQWEKPDVWSQRTNPETGLTIFEKPSSGIWEQLEEPESGFRTYYNPETRETRYTYPWEFWNENGIRQQTVYKIEELGGLKIYKPCKRYVDVDRHATFLLKSHDQCSYFEPNGSCVSWYPVARDGLKKILGSCTSEIPIPCMCGIYGPQSRSNSDSCATWTFLFLVLVVVCDTNDIKKYIRQLYKSATPNVKQHPTPGELNLFLYKFIKRFETLIYSIFYKDIGLKGKYFGLTDDRSPFGRLKPSEI